MLISYNGLNCIFNYNDLSVGIYRQKSVKKTGNLLQCRIRNLGGIPVVCGILPHRAVGASWRCAAFATNSLLSKHYKRNGWLFIENWTRFYGKDHLYTRDGVQISPREVGVLVWRLEREMRTRLFFRDQDDVKEKISKFDDRDGSTIGITGGKTVRIYI